MQNRIVVSETEILAAMQHFETAAGPSDGVSICKEVSQLADLLGVMWYAHETQASVGADSPVAKLLAQAGVLDLAEEDAEDEVEVPTVA